MQLSRVVLAVSLLPSIFSGAWALAQQVVLTGPLPPKLISTDTHNQSFIALRNLNAVSSHEHTTLKHPVFPAHSVRIKESSRWLDDEINAHHEPSSQQYFFLSRANVDVDPLMMWINGGPGGSSSMGLFMELGPCSVDPKSVHKTIWNPHSWTNNASILFLDQPVGVGFSYADYGISVSTTEAAAEDVYAFLFLFIEHFEAFKGREVHLAGESYAGRYLPIFASEIIDRNRDAVKAGYVPINLKSVITGNGWTDYATQVDSYVDIQCTALSYPPVASIAGCVKMRQMASNLQRKVTYLLAT
ncbi:hypothetical protein FRB96_005577 [Tulasnella sp. 330]|nr:hypothetical protein FRB96_005577 [Tulasnella sp. 330]